MPLSRQFSTETPEETQFWLETILHSLDIGNVAWPWEQASRWARMVGTEFKLQVVREQEAGIPVSEYMKIPHNMYEEAVLPKLAGGRSASQTSSSSLASRFAPGLHRCRRF